MCKENKEGADRGAERTAEVVVTTSQVAEDGVEVAGLLDALQETRQKTSVSMMK